MTEFVRFRCNNCGHRFETEVLSEDERRAARQRNQSTSQVYCPQCKRTDIRPRLGVVEFIVRASVR